MKRPIKILPKEVMKIAEGKLFFYCFARKTRGIYKSVTVFGSVGKFIISIYKKNKLTMKRPCFLRRIYKS